MTTPNETAAAKIIGPVERALRTAGQIGGAAAAVIVVLLPVLAELGLSTPAWLGGALVALAGSLISAAQNLREYLRDLRDQANEDPAAG